MRMRKLFNKNSSAADALNAGKRRHMTIRRLDTHMSTFINPIERWADNNYVPYELDYVYHRKSVSSEIVAPLHGFEAPDVYVGMSHGHVIILLSHDDGTGYHARQEFYCEVPLPPDLKLKEAYLEIGPCFLSVYLIPKQSVFKWAVSMACRVKLAWQRP